MICYVICLPLYFKFYCNESDQNPNKICNLPSLYNREGASHIQYLEFVKQNDEKAKLIHLKVVKNQSQPGLFGSKFGLSWIS